MKACGILAVSCGRIFLRNMFRALWTASRPTFVRPGSERDFFLRFSPTVNERLISLQWRDNLPAPVHYGLWLSLVERHVRDVEAVGSNPTSPMTCSRRLSLTLR